MFAFGILLLLMMCGACIGGAAAALLRRFMGKWPVHPAFYGALGGVCTSAVASVVVFLL